MVGGNVVGALESGDRLETRDEGISPNVRRGMLLHLHTSGEIPSYNATHRAILIEASKGEDTDLSPTSRNTNLVRGLCPELLLDSLPMPVLPDSGHRIVPRAMI